jgi:hypothetical protein
MISLLHFLEGYLHYYALMQASTWKINCGCHRHTRHTTEILANETSIFDLRNLNGTFCFEKGFHREKRADYTYTGFACPEHSVRRSVLSQQSWFGLR